MTTEEKLLKLTALTVRMRNTQQKYFEFRSKHLLIEAKRFESQVDQMLIDIMNEYNVKSGQSSQQLRMI
jgi:hypothetical protein